MRVRGVSRSVCWRAGITCAWRTCQPRSAAHCESITKGSCCRLSSPNRSARIRCGMTDFAARIEHARTRMEDLGIDLMYLTPGANTYYLSGWHRIAPSFGATHRPANFLMGMLLGLNHGPIFVVPRM